jgi:hypothetical protein
MLLNENLPPLPSRRCEVHGRHGFHEGGYLTMKKKKVLRNDRPPIIDTKNLTNFIYTG